MSVFDTKDKSVIRFVLAQEREMKCHLLAVAIKEDKIIYFLKLAKILLDAPISDGGISTEVIEDIEQYPDLYLIPNNNN